MHNKQQGKSSGSSGQIMDWIALEHEAFSEHEFLTYCLRHWMRQLDLHMTLSTIFHLLATSKMHCLCGMQYRVCWGLQGGGRTRGGLQGAC